MGFVDALKGVLAKVRAMGKTEKDILNAVENAAEKATVNREALRAMIEPATKTREERQKPRVVFEQGDILVIARDTPKGTKYYMDQKTHKIWLKVMCKIMYEKKTNNWRRMHGLPMKREVNRRKSCERGKRTDNHPKNANVS